MVDLRKRRLFTRSEAADIINLFEDILIENNICVPSPEDEERDPDDMVGLYGTTYSDLLDDVESALVQMLDYYKKHNPEIITDTFNDFESKEGERCTRCHS